MFSEKDLTELLEYRPGEPMLSVYLNIDPSAGPADAHKLRMRQLLKEYEGALPEDTSAVNRYLEHEFDWSGRGLAIFSHAKDGFLRTFTLQVPVRDRARVLDHPYVKPLVDVTENFGHYGIALVDQQGARLFHFHMGTLEEGEDFQGEEVRRTKVGGSQIPGGRGSASAAAYYVNEVADRNLRQAAKTAARFFKEEDVRRVLVGGTDETVPQFVEALPKQWRSLIVGTFSVDMNTGPRQILEQAMAVAQQAEREKEARLVERIVTAAAKGREGVVGLDETLGAVHDGRVQTLAVSEGFRAPGYRCKGCQYISGFALEACPFCGGEFETIDDAVELAVQRVIKSGGEVEIVRDNPALENAGRIGALLRY
jgi:peptide chain release factor subunit 1